MLQIDREIIDLSQRLVMAKSYAPSKNINNIFENLIKLILENREGYDLDEIKYQEIIKLLQICSAKAEGELEKYWSDYFLNKKSLQMSDLLDFIYYENYRKVVENEFSDIKKYLGKLPKKVLFVGSGSLPLTSILAANEFDLEIDCLDFDFQAIEKSTELVKRLKLEKIKFFQADFFEFKNFVKYDFVFIAALVGEDKLEKKAVFKHLKKYLNVDQAFLIRYGAGLNSLCYLNIEDSWLKDFNQVIKIQPADGTLNNYLLAKN